MRELTDFVADPSAGAMTMFVGTTRNTNDGARWFAWNMSATRAWPRKNGQDCDGSSYALADCQIA